MCSILAFFPEVDIEGHLDDDIAFDGVLVAESKLKIQCEPRYVYHLDVSLIFQTFAC